MMNSTTHIEVSWDAAEIRHELRGAVVQLSQHCLKLASKWACEQLIGLEGIEDDAQITTVPIKMTAQELYSKSLLELGEYAHAAAVLSQAASHVTVVASPQPNLTSFGIFLRAYALYLAGEQRHHQEQLEYKETTAAASKSAARISQGGALSKNPFLEQLRNELAREFDCNNLDAFGCYVYGLVLKESLPIQGKHTPNDVLLQSIRHFPFNWSAWLDYAELPQNADTNDQLHREFGSHYMYHFYTAHCLVQRQQYEASIQVHDKLLQPSGALFTNSPYIATKIAVAHYHLREFHLAQHCFVQLQSRHAYRLDEMDTYSNILYVQNQSVALSQLAHTAMRVDKYRPETCCIVGNYYSLKGIRTKAIVYFQRALKLNPHYTGAWTLMGHEYVELKNTPAAMEAYRQAADISPQDYRAWYGLGQAYEILGMSLYALYYYRKACSVRPYDARMWSAVAGCYLQLGKRAEAVRSFERAAMQNDAEGVATTALAKLYREDGEDDKAARCFWQHLQLRYLATVMHPSEQPSIQDIVQAIPVQSTEATALLFLAHHYVTSGELETAVLCATKLLEYPGPEKEEGKAVLREIRSRSTSSVGATPSF
jgi:anaphase-promoting complex subunit 8